MGQLLRCQGSLGLLARLASRSAHICDQLSRGPDVGQQGSLKEVGVGVSALRRGLFPLALPLKPSMEQVWGEPLKPSMRHVLEAEVHLRDCGCRSCVISAQGWSGAGDAGASLRDSQVGPWELKLAILWVTWCCSGTQGTRPDPGQVLINYRLTDTEGVISHLGLKLGSWVVPWSLRAEPAPLGQWEGVSWHGGGSPKSNRVSSVMCNSGRQELP